ncbi:hypothetical protein BH10PLA1_BH10PLA1_16040 [soil metagenome]
MTALVMVKRAPKNARSHVILSAAKDLVDALGSWIIRQS